MKNTIELSSSQDCLHSRHRRCQSDPLLLLASERVCLEQGEELSLDGSLWEDPCFSSAPPCLPTEFLSSSSKSRNHSNIMRQSISLICLSSYIQDDHVGVWNKEQDEPDQASRPTPIVSTSKHDLAHQSDVPRREMTSSPPAPATSRTDEEMLLLLNHLLDAIDRSQWKTVSSILEMNPHLARHPVSMVVQGENSTCLLVHLLSGRDDTPVAVIDQLVTLHPASLLQAESRGGRLPIHIAVVKESHPELVRYLCRARPQALQRPDQEGNLPLHYAAMYGSSPEVLRTLLQAYPQACAHANTRDRFPIHLVCARCYEGEDDDNSDHQKPLVSLEDLETIIQAYRPALLAGDRFGRTPLHLACNVLHPQWHLLQRLIECEPECLLLKDKARHIPLHCARKGKRRGNDLVVASLTEATQKERKRQHKSGISSWFVSLHSSPSSTSSRKHQPKDLYCCYG